MSKSAFISIVCAMFFGLVVPASAAHAAHGDNPRKISEPGYYSGYAPELYDGYQRTSFYVPVRDGTKLAVDLFRPTLHGVLAKRRLPVIWMNTPYNRRYGFHHMPTVSSYPGFALQLVKYGYNVAVVDFRGLYASYGTNKVFNFGEYLPPATTDAYDMTQWFAKQPWSNGRVGMWGCSATGGSQVQAATTRPPALRAIFPMSSVFDAYSFLVIGGIPLRPFMPPSQAITLDRDKSAALVDGPNGKSELAQAIAGHKNNIDAPDVGVGTNLPFRDSRAAELGGIKWWAVSSPSTHLRALQHGHFGVYATSNWDEAGTKLAAFELFANLPKGRVKLLVGPGRHCGWQTAWLDTGFSVVTEERRFYDYWLKGIQNGVMRQPPVTYYTYNAPPQSAWQTSWTWPPANAMKTAFYLSRGTLSRVAPRKPGRTSTAMSPEPKANPIFVDRPSGGVVYQTAPLSHNVQITGFPVMKLWISTQAPNTDVIAWLEDVAPNGTTRSYQMFGRLRASDRALGKAPYKDFGLPWHPFLKKDARPLKPGKPTELQFALLPMSYIFPAGHRIRMIVAFSNPSGGPRKPVEVLSGPGALSTLILPVMRGSAP
ncbi:MAG: CocE/NonD family hydrolase [Pseudomonadota bacterium]|jgi:putative CocE/NonD family hydrolase|nr:CocE/NonD family hydrolase [Pseudomonadota bacterium]